MSAGDFLSELIIKVVGVIFCVMFIANFGIAKGEVISENKNEVDFVLENGEVYAIYGTGYEVGTEHTLLFWGEKVFYTI